MLHGEGAIHKGRLLKSGIHLSPFGKSEVLSLVKDPDTSIVEIFGPMSTSIVFQSQCTVLAKFTQNPLFSEFEDILRSNGNC